MTDEDCSSLEIMQGTSERPEQPPAHIMTGVVEGVNWPFTLSAWKPSREDLEALNAGRPIWVRILSHAVYPMSLFTTDEQGDINQ